MRNRFISSEQNPDIKHIKALRDRRSVRHAERICIVEGSRFIEDAAKVQTPLLLVVSETRGVDELPIADDVLVIPDSLFARISDTTTPQGMLAVFSFPDRSLAVEGVPLILVADGVQDPGNLGTMIRSATALGATKVVCGAGTVDPFAPKVIRAAGATQWLMPIVLAEDLAAELRDIHINIADGNANVWIDQVDFRTESAIVVGSEGHGVSSAVRELPHTSVAIPMEQSVESLNAGIAASIILYEARRQRRGSQEC